MLLTLSVFQAAARAADGGAPIEITGTLRDPAGAPVPNVVVFAAEDGTDRMSAFAVSDVSGRIVLRVPPRRHNFGVVSSRLGVASIVHTGPASFVMELRPLSSIPPEPAQRQRTLPLVVERSRVIRGRVSDETGRELAGVRVEAIRADQIPAAATVTDTRGHFALGLVGGRFQLRALAPGLKLGKGVRRDDWLELTMEVDAQAEQVSVVQGHVLRFRLDQSVDPEIFPPGPVRAWLCMSYGIVVRSRIPTNSERRQFKKYWYLDLLRHPPPNPAAVHEWDRSCVPEADDWALGRIGAAGQNRPLIESFGGRRLPPSIFAR